LVGVAGDLGAIPLAEILRPGDEAPGVPLLLAT